MCCVFTAYFGQSKFFVGICCLLLVGQGHIMRCSCQEMIVIGIDC